MSSNKIGRDDFKKLLLEAIDNIDNPYHPLAWINGEPEIGEGTFIGGFSEINAKGALVRIGRNCDIASFVAINVADSHLRCIGLSATIKRANIEIADNVFVGSHCAILGGSIIGNNSVIAAGTVIRGIEIPPFSLVLPNKVKPGYYRNRDKLVEQ